MPQNHRWCRAVRGSFTLFNQTQLCWTLKWEEQQLSHPVWSVLRVCPQLLTLILDFCPCAGPLGAVASLCVVPQPWVGESIRVLELENLHCPFHLSNALKCGPLRREMPLPQKPGRSQRAQCLTSHHTMSFRLNVFWFTRKWWRKSKGWCWFFISSSIVVLNLEKCSSQKQGIAAWHCVSHHRPLLASSQIIPQFFPPVLDSVWAVHQLLKSEQKPSQAQAGVYW